MYTVDGYFKTQFNDIDMEIINVEIQEFVNRCRTLPKAMKNWPAFIDLKKKIDDFYECCPLIELMASNAMKLRHWESLEKIMKFKFDTTDEDFTLGYVMKAPLQQYKEDIEEICVGASKEQDIEVKLQTVIRDWKDINMPLALFKNRGEILIKASDVQDIITKLEDSLMIMSSLASNRYNAPFKKDIMLWLHKLSNTTEILEKWLQVQSLWMYLEAVFVGGDISKQLPQETKRFQNIDKAWIKVRIFFKYFFKLFYFFVSQIMYKTRDNPNVIDICTGDDIVDTTLNFLVEQLELCQKSLTVYLESKRLIFPRFFFISDPVLLEILGQASDPNSIQPHLLSIFDGVARVEFDEKRLDTIVAMYSNNGERIPLNTDVRCVGLVENWIGKLLDSVLETVKSILSGLGQKIGDPKFDYRTQLTNLCAQAQLICIQLLWTKDAEYALNTCKNDRKIMAKTNLLFQDMLNYLVDQTVKDLTKLERISCETLVTIHVHQRDIFDDLVRFKIKNPQDFEWQKQARFYFDLNNEEVIVKITDIDFIYQNEYLGVTDRLAITPLTDRCYITLAQAIGMYMGGAPAG
jgi:dynein heavy chain, axonemal